jgi:hypothetical protein
MSEKTTSFNSSTSFAIKFATKLCSSNPPWRHVAMTINDIKPPFRGNIYHFKSNFSPLFKRNYKDISPRNYKVGPVVLKYMFNFNQYYLFSVQTRVEFQGNCRYVTKFTKFSHFLSCVRISRNRRRINHEVEVGICHARTNSESQSVR